MLCDSEKAAAEDIPPCWLQHQSSKRTSLVLFTVVGERSCVVYCPGFCGCHSDLKRPLTHSQLFILKVQDTWHLFVILPTRARRSCPHTDGCFCGFSAYLDFSSSPGRIKAEAMFFNQSVVIPARKITAAAKLLPRPIRDERALGTTLWGDCIHSRERLHPNLEHHRTSREKPEQDDIRVIQSPNQTLHTPRNKRAVMKHVQKDQCASDSWKHNNNNKKN